MPGSRTAGATATRPISAIIIALGALCLLGAALMSFLLVLEHIEGIELPGCGEGSPCQEVAEGFGGKIPLGVLEWPTSFLGFSYFAAALAAWLAAGGRLPTSQRILVRFGLLASIGFTTLLFVKWQICQYCVAAHVGNLLFWICMEAAARQSRASARAPAWISAVLVFAFSSVGVGVWNAAVESANIARGEEERSESVAQIIEQARGVDEEPTTTTSSIPPVTVESDPEPNQPEPDDSAAVAEPNEPGATTDVEPHEPVTAEPPDGAPFAGRYLWGPEKAPIRIVMITSYQCPDCRRVENDLQRLQEQHKDTGKLNVSIKHFPFNTECNKHVGRTTQPNACWAARAAEAAGVLWGSDGFWKMHHWLFARSGVFRTQKELYEGIRSLGYEPGNFVQVMSSDEMVERIRADCDEAKQLGLYFTPMIFINGVELKGWHVPKALPRTVSELLKQDLPARTNAADRPPLAIEKYIADWREGDTIELPADDPEHRIGPEQADVRVVIWGDYEEDGTRRVDRVMRDYLAAHDNVCYTFRHYPFNSDCNPHLKDQRHPNACAAAYAVEAAATLGGNAAFWALHAWLMENTQPLTDELLQAAAIACDLDPHELLELMNSESVKSALREDITAAKQLPRLRIGVPPGLYAIPTIIVNEKHVPRWKLPGHDVIERILKEAATESTP